MPRTVQPTLHERSDGLRAVGDILADDLLAISHCAHAICRQLSVEVAMLEVVVLGHVGGMSEGNVGERARKRKRRRRWEIALAAACSARTYVIHELQRLT